MGADTLGQGMVCRITPPPFMRFYWGGQVGTWRGRFGVRVGQPEDVVDVGGEQAVAAMLVLGIQVLVQAVDDGGHGLKGDLTEVHWEQTGASHSGKVL